MNYDSFSSLIPHLSSLIFFALACAPQYRPPHAVGKPTEIIVVSEDEPYYAIDSLLSAVLERVIYTPTQENIFNIKKVNTQKFPNFKYRRNILILGLIGDPIIDSTLSPSAMKKALSGELYIFGAENLFISEQCVLVIVAPTIYKLNEVIESNADLIFNYFAEGVRKSLKEILYKDGYQEDLANRLGKRYGFSISIPYGWIEAKEEFGVVEFIRHSPDRIISIHWETSPDEDINKERAIFMRNKLGNKYWDGDSVDTSHTSFYWVNFHNLKAGKLDGIWQNDAKVMGGPFRSYLFLTGGRLYFIDMHIFAPGEKKWRWLQQLEIIVDTFS